MFVHAFFRQRPSAGTRRFFNPLVQALIVMLIAWRLVPLALPTPVLASGCSPVASLSADVAPSGSFDTAANVVATFDNARQAEGCTTPLSINQSAFNSATPQQQMLMLFNAERTDRGLGSLTLDPTLLSQIDLNHSHEMAQYGYFAHQSPINQPSSVFARVTDNPAISGHFSYLGENIAAGYSTAAAAVYTYMYQDSGSSWGHRHNILGYTNGTFGNFNYVGIGVFNGGQYNMYYSSDFMQSSNYVSPARTDTQAPSLSAPTITSGATGGTVSVQVTGVQDTGSCCGEAGITGVTFYAGQVSYSNGAFNTVAATQSSPGVWTASLTLPAGATLHAVAVDGSGNYTDVASGSTSATPATISASPNPVPGGSSSTTISWNTGNGTSGQVYVSMNGGAEALFTQGSGGSATATWISSGSTYVFSLYAGSSHTTKLASVTVTTATPATISASPNPVPVGSSTTSISWNTGDGSAGQVYVSVNGGADTLFAQGSSGSASATWISAGATYVFKLYAGNSHTTQLTSVSVRGTTGTPATISASPNPVPGGSSSTTISWNTGNGTSGQVYVSMNGGAEALFTQGSGGSATATWISSGSTYVFSLYAGSSHTTKLASVTVT